MRAPPLPLALGFTDVARYTDKYKPPAAKLTSLKLEDYPDAQNFAPQLYQQQFFPQVKPKGPFLPRVDQTAFRR